MKTLEQLADDYLGMARLRGCAEVWLEFHRYIIRRYARWINERLGVSSPSELTADTIRAWLQMLDEYRQVPDGRPLKPISIWTYVSAVRRFHRWLEDFGHIPSSVLQAFPVFKTPAIVARSALPHKEMRKFIRSLPTSTPEQLQLRALAEFLYTTGSRISEALNMNVGDLDFDLEQVRLYGKGRKERMVPVGRIALLRTREYLRAIRPLFVRDPAESAFWLSTAGTRLRYKAFRVRWSKLIENIPTPHHVTAHLFRRSFTTELVHAGADLWAVKEMLGHENLETMSHYVQLNIAALKETHATYHPRDNGMDDATWLPGSTEEAS